MRKYHGIAKKMENIDIIGKLLIVYKSNREIDIFNYDYISVYIGTNLFMATMNVIYYADSIL